jgi:Putative protein-S-isoprenylcysteine methyltransferase
LKACRRAGRGASNSRIAGRHVRGDIDSGGKLRGDGHDDNLVPRRAAAHDGWNAGPLLQQGALFAVAGCHRRAVRRGRVDGLGPPDAGPPQFPRRGGSHGRGLVTGGPYRFIRHPIYTAACLFGWAGMLGNWSWRAGLFGALLFLGALGRMLCEERLVTEQYPEYRQYAKSTKRMVPGVF